MITVALHPPLHHPLHPIDPNGQSVSQNLKRGEEEIKHEADREEEEIDYNCVSRAFTQLSDAFVVRIPSPPPSLGSADVVIVVHPPRLSLPPDGPLFPEEEKWRVS